MPKRSGKFYSQNEKHTLKALGLTPAPASGAGWVVKEDGENETLMVQLKSTDSLSYRLSRLDMKKLEFHADVSHKVPVFLVQFLKDDRLYAIVDVKNIDDLFYGLKGIKPNTTSVDIASIKEEIEEIDIASTSKEKKEKINKKEKRESEVPIIKTSKSSRDSFFREQKKSRKNFKKGIYK
jgi:hypothetical protein